MRIELASGDTLSVVMEGTDGEFKVIWGENVLQVTADLPDSSGREGVIYEETWGDTRSTDEEPVPDPIKSIEDLGPGDKVRLAQPSGGTACGWECSNTWTTDYTWVVASPEHRRMWCVERSVLVDFFKDTLVKEVPEC